MCSPKPLHRSIKDLLRSLQTQIDTITHQVDEAVMQVKHWRTKVEILTSILGVGKVLAYTLIGELPELGKLPKVAIIACMRKLIVVLKNETRWGENMA